MWSGSSATVRESWRASTWAATGSSPTRSSAMPICRSPTRRCWAGSTRRASHGAAATRRRACCGWRACEGAAPSGAAHHNIHFGREWEDSFKAITKPRGPDARSVDPREHGVAQRCLPGAGGLLDAACARTDAEPRRQARLGPQRGSISPKICGAGSATSAIPSTTSWSSGRSTRSIGSRWGSSAAHRSPCRTPCARPVRSGPETPIDRVPGLVFTGSSTLPGVGVPMVLVSGKLAAQRVDEYARATSLLKW